MNPSAQVRAQIDAATALLRPGGRYVAPVGASASLEAVPRKAALQQTPVKRPQTLGGATEPHEQTQSSASDSLLQHAERTILGALIFDGDRLSEVSGRIQPRDFCLESHQRIFRAMLALGRAGQHIDAVTLPDQLAKTKGGVEMVGGAAYVAGLTEGLPMRPVIKAYIRIVKEKSQVRKLQALVEAIKARVDAGGETPAEISTWAAQEFTMVAAEDGSDADGLHLLKGSEIVEQDHPMVLPDHLPDHTAVTINGRPGDGKTTGGLLICADLSNGKTPYTGTPCPARSVLVMSNEDSPSRIRKLFTAAGGDVNRLRVENCDDLWQLSDLARLEKAISTNAIGCVVIDSLASHSGKSDLNSHQDTMQLLVPLRAVAEKHRCLILVIHHLNKSLSVDHIAKVSGSVGIVAAFRHNLHVCVDPENPELRLLVNGKSNLIAPNVPALRFKLFPVGWAGEAQVSIEELYRVTEPDEKPGKAVAWLQEALSDGEWHPAANLQQQATQGFNLSRRSIFRAAETLGLERRKAGFGGRAEWRLRSARGTPDEEPLPLQTKTPEESTPQRDYAEDGDL